MKAKVTYLNKNEKLIVIDLINYNNKMCLHIRVCGNRIYFISDLYDSEKEKCILVKNIGKIIDKACSILGYPESRLESIVFRRNAVNVEYALMTFRKEKQ